MTRTSRTILVMGLMAVGGVAALTWMAQRYGQALSRQPGAAEAGDARLPPADAERLVAAYVSVARALDAARTNVSSDREREDATRVALSRALALHDLTPERYRQLETLEQAWRAGSADVPRAYREALERQRDRVPR